MFHSAESSPPVDEGADMTLIAKSNQNFPDCSQPQPHFVFMHITKCLRTKVLHCPVSIITMMMIYETGCSCTSGCPGTHSSDQAGLELTDDPLASAPQALECCRILV